MRFSEFAGTAMIPTLARLVLAAAFIPVGYNKLFTTAEFDPHAAAVLEHYGVTVTAVDDSGIAPAGEEDGSETDPAADPPVEQPDEDQARSEDGRAGPQILAVAFQEAETPALESEEPPAAAADPSVQVEVQVEMLLSKPDGTYEAAALHRITILCHDASLEYPNYLATVAALTEFIGGILLLIGFLSRVWGLGLAVAMGTAFYLVSIRQLGVFETSPFAFAQDINAYTTVFAQLGLFVLAFGILLTGPGPLSVDRLLSGKPGRKDTSPKEAAAAVDHGAPPPPRRAAPPPPPPPPPPAPLEEAPPEIKLDDDTAPPPGGGRPL